MRVSPADAACLPELALGDFSFDVHAQFVEPFEGRCVTPVDPPYRKTYGFDQAELSQYIVRSDAELFVAYDDGAPVAYIAVAQSWNHFAVIEDIAVDAIHRRRGIARRLLDAAVGWARERDLAGVRLETQSNNVSACHVYDRYGFVLGGYDRYLYRGIPANDREVALFWYLLFRDVSECSSEELPVIGTGTPY